MDKKFILFILFLFSGINFLFSMEEYHIPEDNPYVIRGWMPPVTPRSTGQVLRKYPSFHPSRSSVVLPQGLPKPFVAQLVETLADYYQPMGEILNLNRERIGCQVNWDDFRDIYKAILQFRQHHNIRILNLKNNDLKFETFPSEIIIHMMQNKSLEIVLFEGNPICEAINFDVMIRDFTQLINSKSTSRRVFEFILSGIIKIGEEQLDIQKTIDDSAAEANTIIFDLGGDKKYKVQKKLVNFPSNYLHRLMPLLSKLSFMGIVYVVSALSIYFAQGASFDPSECSLEALYTLFGGCGLNETEFINLLAGV